MKAINFSVAENLLLFNYEGIIKEAVEIRKDRNI